MKYKFSIFIFSLLVLSFSSKAQLQLIRTVAGNGETGFYGDGGTAEAARLSGPLDVAVDNFGNVFVDDWYNNRVRKVLPSGIITTIAGNGIEGYTGDGSISSNAEIMPSGIAVDKYGNLFISDKSHSVVRKVSTSGIITRYAGTGTFGHSGDGGAATSAKIGTPFGLAVDTAGNLYIADASQHNIRKVSKTGIISTVAGIDIAGYFGDGGMATDAKLDSPRSVAVDRKGNIYVTDFNNNVIRKIATDKTISTYAGMQAVLGYSGDGGPATDATLNMPRGIAVDTAGNLFIADAENNVVRMVDTQDRITTVIGNGTLGYSGDFSYSLGCALHNPYAVAVDKYGSIFVADANNQRVRVSYNPALAVRQVTAADISVYPNPAQAEIIVSGTDKTDKISISDVMGRTVVTTNVTGTQHVNIASLQAGMYQLQVYDIAGNKKANVKFVKE